MKAISLHSIVPVRAKAGETAEMTTQMLFGETCDVLLNRQSWTKVRLDTDGQEGWVDAKMISPLTEQEYLSLPHSGEAEGALVSMPMAYALSLNNGQTIPLCAGTRLYNYKEGQFSLLGVSFRIDPSMVVERPLVLNQQNLLAVVRFFLNIPYLWGGKNAMGMDCSGFSQTIMRIFGRALLRNAGEQATQGKAVRSLRTVQAGDLVFFDHAFTAASGQAPSGSSADSSTRITHVGIAIDSERIIHCSGRVKVEKLDSEGIYSAEYGRYTHHLHSIRRV